MNQFFTVDFLFNINRVLIEPVDKGFLFIGVAFVVLAIVFKLGAKFAPSIVDAKYRNKFFHLFLTIGLMEIIWFVARLQFIRLFGTHLIALLVLLVGLFWFGWIIKKMIQNYRKEKQEWERLELKKKYLPK